jgi:hypothetical protein
MRKLLTISLLSALPVALVATVLVGHNGDGGRTTESRRSAPPTTTTTSTTPTTTSTNARSEATPDEPADGAQLSGAEQKPTGPAEMHFVCPEGGMDAVEELQHAVDEGHQPWRLSAQDVAAACTFGVSGTSSEPAGTNRYHVTHPATGRGAVVDLAQPFGAGTIWAVTHITFDPPAVPAGHCSPEVALPAVRDALEQPDGPDIVTVDVHECQHGYARVFAVPDNSTCGQSNGSCYDNEQVFLRASGDSWTYLTSGSGISCQDPDIQPDLSVACRALGLR